MSRKFSIVAIGCAIILVGLSCRRGEIVPVDRSMLFSLDLFITDTSVYQAVELNGTSLLAKANQINGSYANILYEAGGIPRPEGKLAFLQAHIIKKNQPNIEYSDSIPLTNVNDYLLLQLDPKKPPVLVNKKTESQDYPSIPGDSVGVRFFFNDADRMVNPHNDNSKVGAVDLQLYTLGEDQSGMPVPKKWTLIKGIKANQLSRFFLFKKGEIAGFDLLDANPDLEDDQRLLQRASFDEYDYFIDGRIEVADPRVSGRYQTLRIQRTDGWGAYYGKFLFGFQ
ncbi:hypothetical protein [Flavihumibacter solisilvae]|uniref:Uncharacterized protein n=1 Tax=Flavihumibacter solisilvae TaxID=1349421 RepID=A0A0C1L1U7_9BACT|nr:hypothetical protein [Flavihumibacter solisilvae]KIC93561.1 hypothetical protein OI18_17670 [Flavihumibacter solisilvae]